VTQLGHFGNLRKTVTWSPENRGSVAVQFHLKNAVFGFKTVGRLYQCYFLNWIHCT